MALRHPFASMSLSLSSLPPRLLLLLLLTTLLAPSDTRHGGPAVVVAQFVALQVQGSTMGMSRLPGAVSVPADGTVDAAISASGGEEDGLAAGASSDAAAAVVAAAGGEPEEGASQEGGEEASNDPVSAGLASGEPLVVEGSPPYWDIVRRFPIAKYNRRLIIYNRVPKTGSTSIQDMMNQLARRNNFKVEHRTHPPTRCPVRMLGAYKAWSVTPAVSDIDKYARYYTSLQANNYQKKGVVADHHWPYVNFSNALPRPNGKLLLQPLYINTIREPVSRLISAYYYQRLGPRVPLFMKRVREEFGNLSVEQCMQIYRDCKCKEMCITREELRCTRNRCQDLFYEMFDGAQFMYFCPWGAPECAQASRAALERSKAMLRDHYAAFMILERPESRSVLELALPTFFKGLGSLPETESRITSKKPPTPPAVKDEIAALMQLDVEFYAYAQKLFDVHLQQAAQRRAYLRQQLQQQRGH